MIDGGVRWYVVQTHAHAETKAAAHLERQGFASYLPRYLKRRRHARRVEIVGTPLFPRYLFVSIDREKQRWISIRSTIGVTRLVCNGDEPVSLQASVVDELRSREVGGFVQLERRRFSPGDRVRITDGVFSSCLGLYEGMRDDERVTVLLDLLGRRFALSSMISQ